MQPELTFPLMSYLQIIGGEIVSLVWMVSGVRGQGLPNFGFHKEAGCNCQHQKWGIWMIFLQQRTGF